MDAPVHPLIRRLYRAAEAASAAARRLEPADPPRRRFESSLDDLLVVSQSARIAALAHSPIGETALARTLSAIETPPTAAPPPNELVTRRRPIGPQIPTRSVVTTLGPRPLAAARIAEAVQSLEALGTANPADSSPPGFRAAVALPRPGHSTAPSTDAFPPAIAITRQAAAQALRSRIETTPLARVGWTSLVSSKAPSGTTLDSPQAFSESVHRTPAESSTARPAPSQKKFHGSTALRTFGNSASTEAAPPASIIGSQPLDPATDPLLRALHRLDSNGADRTRYAPAGRALRSTTSAPSARPVPAPKGTALSKPAFGAQPASEPPLTGLRALAALGERLESEPSQGIHPLSNAPIPTTPFRAITNAPKSSTPSLPPEPHEVAIVLSELLRQEALRHGIETRQGFA